MGLGAWGEEKGSGLVSGRPARPRVRQGGRVFLDTCLLLGRTLMVWGWGPRVGAIEELCQDLAMNLCLGVFAEFVSKYPLLKTLTLFYL